MPTYKILRLIAKSLRFVQVGLLNASFVVSDFAQYTGEAAKRAAHLYFDKLEAGAAARAHKANLALAVASDHLDEALEDAHMDLEDIGVERTLVDREVI